MVLCELYCTRPDERSGRKMLRRTTLADTCDMESVIFRRVLQQLFIHNYITISNTSIVLNCDPAKITVYDLFQIFHGGIPLGEELVQKMDLYTERRYQKVAAMEEDVAKVSRQYFERKTVASMISGRRHIKRNTNE